jgi:hypothetical protein
MHAGMKEEDHDLIELTIYNSRGGKSPSTY